MWIVIVFWYLVSGIWYLVSGIWYLVSGIWYLVIIGNIWPVNIFQKEISVILNIFKKNREPH
ncbi:hypothetical protein EFZ10_05445 [Tatumella sp. TA1]|nr:hypothetical protein EFZ10_05445 [Tatumella sp. TA1]